jgi:hypothetical protein
MSDADKGGGFRYWWSSLTSEQRLSAAVLSICGVLALGLAFNQLHAQVWSPFMVPKAVLERARAFLAQQQDDTQQTEALKTKDTDHDGLSDYDELYVYQTSPYLADSDSDGIPDAIEIAQGMDPNCPRGKTCVQALDTVASRASSTDAFGDLLDITQIPKAPTDLLTQGNASGVAGAQAFLAQPPAPSTMTAPQIRDYLLSNHLVSADQLDQLPDDKVVEVYTKAYEEALKIQAASQGSLSNSAGATSTP